MRDEESKHEIKRLRLALGLTQERFARELGVTLSTVSRWETGRSQPSALAQRRLEELLQKLESQQKANL